MKHLLVIDDDTLFRDQLARRLEDNGYQVTAFAGVGDTLDALDQLQTVAGALVDMRLDDGQGLDLITPLRERFPDCRLLMLTGYGSIPTAVEATRRGADDYLLKPASIADILAALEGTSGDAVAALPEAPPSLDRLEWDYIQHVLNRHDGNISAAARDLGIDRRTLQRRLKKRPSQRDYERDRNDRD